MSDQIDVNYLADALNNKMDLPAGKNQSQVDYVVEWKTPTSSDPTWYRVYKSGWVEQGGFLGAGTGATITITLLKPMANNKYTALKNDGENSSNTASHWCVSCFNLTTTTLQTFQLSAGTYASWQVSGQGA